MGKFSVISGATKVSHCNIKTDRLQLVNGLFGTEDITLAGVQVSTDGLVAPNPKLVRFYLRQGEREWLCEATTNIFSDLQALLYTFNNPRPPAPPMSKLKKWGLIMGGLFIFMILARSKDPSNATVPAKENSAATAQKSPANTQLLTEKEKIGASVLDPYTQKEYPKTFAKFGSRMPDVEKARKASALLAAKSEKCLTVETSEVSDKSAGRNDIKTFVDCKGIDGKNERFRFNEAELKDKSGKFFTEETIKQADKPTTMKDQSVSHESAMTMCKNIVINSAKFPSSVNFSWFDNVVRTSDSSGETWVEISFEAKNSLGAVLPQKATCSFPINGTPTFKIENR